MRPRESQCGRLVAAVDKLERGQGGVVELVGEPGSGKTRMLALVAAEADRRGLKILSGRCTEAQQRTPYFVLSSLHGNLSGRDQPSARTTPVAHELVRSMVDHCAAAGIRILVLDDAHWVDDSVLELVEFLVHWPQLEPMLLVIAHRSRQASARLRGVFAHGVELGVAETIELGPLSLEESADLLGADPADDWVSELHDQAQGLPLYLLLLAGMRGAVLPYGPIPEQVAALALSEFTSLDQRDLAVAWAAALLGDHTDLDALTQVADLSPAETTEAASRLMHRELLRPRATGGLGLRHPVLGRLLYDTIEPSWRAPAHRRALEVLTVRRAPAWEQAEHIERSLTFPDEDEVSILVRGAIEQMWSDPVVAARWLRLALQATPDEEPYRTRRAETSILLGQAMGFSGQLVASRDIFHGILDQATPVSPAVRSAAVASCALADLLLDNAAEAHALLTANLADVVPDSAGSVRRTVALAFVDVLSGRPAAVQQVEQAIRIVQQHDDDIQLAGLRTLRVISELGPDNVSAGERTIVESAATFDALDDLSVARNLWHMATIGWTEFVLGRFADAERHLTRGLRVARKVGHVYALPVFLAGLSRVNRHLGSVTSALRMAEEAGQIAERIGAPQLYALALAEQSLNAAWAMPRGAAEPAKLAKQAAAAAARITSHVWIAGASGALAHAIWFARPVTRRTLAQLVEVTGGMDPIGHRLVNQPARFEMFAAVSADMADAQAGKWADRAEQAQIGLPIQRGYVVAARAHAARAAGEHLQAAKLYQEAASAFRAVGAGLEEGRMLIIAVGCVAKTEGVPEAMAVLATAQDVARRHESRWLLDVAEEVEHRLSASTADAATLARLTDREREIALHAGSGKRTRHIAEELALSPRTVDLHLARVYRKLNLSSRAALARLIAEVERTGRDGYRTSGPQP